MGKYRAMIWCCQHKYGNGEPNKTPHMTEDQIKTENLKALLQSFTKNCSIECKFY